MRIPRPIVDALKKAPAVRRGRNAALAALHTARVGRDTLFYSLTGTTYAATHLEREARASSWDPGTSAADIQRFRNIWELIPPRPYRRILEIGCADGHFTRQIVDRVPNADVLAVDFIPLVLERARARCGNHPGLQFRCLDVGKENLPGMFDLIFCMGVLVYGPSLRELNTIRDRILEWLALGRYLLLESGLVASEFENRWWARRLGYGARALHDRFALDGMTAVSKAIVWGGWRLATLFQKTPAPTSSSPRHSG